MLSGKDGYMAWAKKLKISSKSHFQKATLQHFQKGCCRQVEMGHPVHSELRWAPGRLVVMNIVGAATWSILWTNVLSTLKLWRMRSQNLNTGQFVSQSSCPIVFLPTAVAKHRCCESGCVNHHTFEPPLGPSNLVSNSLMVVLEKTWSMSQRGLFSNCCFWLSIESTSNFVRCLIELFCFCSG